MCGIAGIVGIKDKNTAANKINLMTESIAHRGPDAEGIYVDDLVAFGHRRLSIIDLSDSANQPFFDPTNRYSLIFNGEIYNFREVKQKLFDYPFKTVSDTEVVLAAFIKFGVDFLSMLNGMFALAIWDKFTQELFIARDRMGVKPLYYHLNDDGIFIFASEIRSILKTDLVPRNLNKEALYDYLLFQSVYSPLTIVENIYQLPAGHYATFSHNKLTDFSYWKITEPNNQFDFDDPRSIKTMVHELLTKSVERRMISDVSLGAFLSGGIDSSAIVGLMSEISDRPIQTFSVNFEEKQYDESYYSNLIAKKFNTQHTSILLKAEDLLKELPNALNATDSPSGDGLNSYVVSKATKKAGITVALSGVGGDELFAGYSNFPQWYKTQSGLLPSIPSFIKKPLGHTLSLSNNSKFQRIGQLLKSNKLNLDLFYTISRQVFSQQFALNITQNGFHQTTIQKQLFNERDKIKTFPILSQFTIAELLGYTQNVLLKDMDQFSMASALEVREPFFDFQLVEYVLQIPDKYKYPKYPKSLLVESIAPLLPDEIVHRKKMGFVFPWETWMRNDLFHFCNKRINNLADRDIFNGEYIIKLWNDFQKGKNGVLWSHLWHLVVLTEWLENNKF